MKKVKVSAPGKLMLLGEHAVVYGYSCLVTAIGKYMTVTLEEHDQKNDVFITPQVTNQTFIHSALTIFRGYYSSKKRYTITTESELGMYGFGSSAATVVAVIQALAQIQEVCLTQEQLFNLSLAAVLAVQQKGSGFDVAASIYGGTIFFDGKTKEREILTTDSLPLVVGYTGVKADTVTLLESVEKKRNVYQKRVDTIFDTIGQCAQDGKKALIDKDWKRLGTLFTFTQNYLEDLGVSVEKLNTLITAALKAGAYGAKLSGAGGGDCMIALVSPEKKEDVIHSIKQNEGEVISCETSVQGVHIV